MNHGKMLHRSPALTKSRCPYGCCTDGLSPRQERRRARRRENREWKKENTNV